jgi:D-alanine-D-alanine ligase
VDSERELRERVQMLHERMRQPVICEEYIQGREIYVGIIGNARLTAFPAREVRFAGPDSGPRFATARVKQDAAYREKWGIEFTHADLPPDLQARAARISKRIYRLLHVRDYGRIDLRITPDHQIVFLEANPNPDLTLGDELAQAAARAGIAYEQLIRRILNLARQRCAAAQG